MCEPTLLAALSLGVTGASGLFSASSQMSQGQRQGRLAVQQGLFESQAGFDEAYGIGDATVEQYATTSKATIDQAQRSTRAYALAAEIARRNVEVALARSNADETRVRDQTRREQGSQSAYFAASNMDPTYGSPLMLAAFGAAQGEADARIVRAAGLQTAADQNWTIYGLNDRASETADAALTSVETGARATRRTLDSAFDTANRRAVSGNRAAGITASNARKAGQYGAATALLNTATQWIGLASKGSLQPIGIKGL